MSFQIGLRWAASIQSSRDAVTAGRLDDGGVVRVEKDVALRVEQLLLVLDLRGLGDAVGVVEHEAEVAQASDARLGAHGGQADLDARVAHRALLGLAGLVVEVDLLVRAARHAHAPAAALVLVDEHDPVLGALVHRAGGARRDARGVEAVLADARQIEHEGLLELGLDLLAHLLEDRVVLHRLDRAAQVVVPVRRPGDLHVLAGEQALRAGDRHLRALRRVQQHVVVVRPRLVVVAGSRGASGWRRCARAWRADRRCAASADRAWCAPSRRPTSPDPRSRAGSRRPAGSRRC